MEQNESASSYSTAEGFSTWMNNMLIRLELIPRRPEGLTHDHIVDALRYVEQSMFKPEPTLMISPAAFRGLKAQLEDK